MDNRGRRGEGKGVRREEVGKRGREGRGEEMGEGGPAKHFRAGSGWPGHRSDTFPRPLTI